MKPVDRILSLIHITEQHGIVASAIIEICGLWSGPAYVHLIRLEREGKIVSEFDPGSYPRRRRYWLTPYRPDLKPQ